MIKKVLTKSIRVPQSFLDTQSSQKKMEAVREYVREHGKLDRPIVLAGDELVDNFIRYLVAIEFGMEHVPTISILDLSKLGEADIPTYIKGKFEGNDKEYTWRINKRMSIEVGDVVLVKSRCKDGSNTAAVTVTNVFTSDDEKLLRHKPVIKKLKGASAKCQVGD